jgi:hypothetical protein
LIVGASDAAGNQAAKKRVDFRVRRGAGTIR